MNGCAPGLALIERLKATRKWAIDNLTSLFLAFPMFSLAGSKKTAKLDEKAVKL